MALQHLVTVVDADLREGILRENFKSKNVQKTDFTRSETVAFRALVVIVDACDDIGEELVEQGHRQ